MCERREPVHGELLICARFLHFLESCQDVAMRDLVNRRKVPEIGWGVSVGRTPRINGRRNCLDPGCTPEHSFGTSLIYRIWPAFPASSQQLLSRHCPEPDPSKLVSLNRRAESFNGFAMRNGFLIEFR